MDYKQCGADVVSGDANGRYAGSKCFNRRVLCLKSRLYQALGLELVACTHQLLFFFSEYDKYGVVVDLLNNRTVQIVAYHNIYGLPEIVIPDNRDRRAVNPF